MLHWTLCVVFILLQLSYNLDAKLDYAIIIPAEIQALCSEVACLHIQGAEGTIRTQLTLNPEKENITLIERHFHQQNVFSCVSFKVSTPLKAHEEVATLAVSICCGEKCVNKQTGIILKKRDPGLLLQTDKAVYKPGQTIKFRIISLNEKLQPRTRPIPVVELMDPERNRIGQWLNVSLDQGIAELSLPLSPEPTAGEYSIKAMSTVHSFTVEEFVLPKYEVMLQFPKMVLFNSEYFPVKICGKYTYGKPVQGVYNGTVCRKAASVKVPICIDLAGKLDRSGCSTVQVKTETFNLTKAGLQRSLNGVVSLTEDGTGTVLSTSSRVPVSWIVSKLFFVNAEKSYKSGIPYSGKLKLEDASGTPLPQKTIYLSYSNQKSDGKLTLSTNRDGLAFFKLENTTHWEGVTTISVKTIKEYPQYRRGFINPEHGRTDMFVSFFYSKSKSVLKLHTLHKTLPCNGQQDVQVQYLIKHTEMDTETKNLDLHYLVTSKGSILDSGTLDIPVGHSNEDLSGKASLNLHVKRNRVSPNLKALVYVFLSSGEMVADSAIFHVQRCFSNNVSVGFSPNEVLPGSNVTLHIQAAAGSLCGLRVVDESVVLMKPEKEMTADKVYSLFPYTNSEKYDYRIATYCDSDVRVHRRRSVSHQSQGRGTRSDDHWPVKTDTDIESLFEGMQLKIITSADIKSPANCESWLDEEYYDTYVTVENDEIHPPESAKKKETVRKYFPETWLWELNAIGASGNSELQRTAPDTITDWNAGVFCMGPSGFGLSAPVSLRTFQPFFVDLTLPYSVVRGEVFSLKASIFNYLKECVKVQTTLQPSLELDEEPCTDCQHTSCLCADQSKTFHWNLKATKLGEVNITVRTEALNTQDLCHNELPIVPTEGSIDTVIKLLLVQPGGVLEEKSHSSLLCIEKGKDHSKTEAISLNVPENILKDSERAYVTILGDLMGTAMQNLDRLLAMPYGCGEQNMVLFAPNIFILQYLVNTQQLNDKIRRKAKNFLESGYQRQLTYKHSDGSYSAFGKSDKKGNTWLTAFVVKSFSNARTHIHIDETHLAHSFTWLKDHRQGSGCFRSVGKLFNNAMKGGVDDDISLSAYVTIALLESGMSPQDTLITDALSCLGTAALNVSSIYTQALLSYAFTLSGETDLRKILIEKLEGRAIRSAGQLHWEQNSTPRSSDLPYWDRAPSVEVELASYMLLTFLSGPEQDLGKASEIVNWLSKQQNPYGGFSSTQDTVVALQALAKYAEATFSDTWDVTVTIRSQTGVTKFNVDNTNRLLLQRMPLPDIPGIYSLRATGSGCVFVQTVLRYNVPPPSRDATFVVRVEIKPDQCPEGSSTKLQIHITAEYTGSRVKSNMALIEVKMLSGFIPVKSSVIELEKSKVVQRSDIHIDMVTLYLDELGHDAVHVSFEVEKDHEVKNLKPATVRVYDYYVTEDYTITEYNSPCSSGKNIALLLSVYCPAHSLSSVSAFNLIQHIRCNYYCPPKDVAAPACVSPFSPGPVVRYDIITTTKKVYPQAVLTAAPLNIRLFMILIERESTRSANA
ncbi:alpha-2-macroglobulin-like protein 1 [Pelodytes ibericus]